MPSSWASSWTLLLLLGAVLVVMDRPATPTTASARPVPDPELRARRYVVSVPPRAVNLTGWVPAVVPLGEAVFGSRPYIVG